MQKQWTVKDGVIGTHHLNRAGVSADFRPATEIGGDVREIRIAPPKGQALPMLVLPVQRRKDIRVSPVQEDGTVWIETTIKSDWEGVEVSYTFPNGTMVVDADKAAEAAKKRAEFSRSYAELREDVNKFVQELLDGQIVNHLDRRQVGRLESGRRDATELFVQVAQQLVEEKFGGIGVIHIPQSRIWEQAPLLLEKVMEHQAAVKAAKKAAWCA